jgi:cytochrome c-type biogenesis protein CcmH/NrfG
VTRRTTMIGIIVVALTVVIGCTRPDDQAGGAQQSSRLADQDRERVRQFWIVYRQGTQARVAGNTDAAAEAYRQALTFDPEHADALYYLGNMELQRERLSEAEASWGRLLDLDSTSARAHVQLGRVLSCPDRDTLDLAGARQAFERAILINQEETGPLLLLAEVTLALKDIPRARRIFQDALRTNEGSVGANYYLGFIHWTSGDRARANDFFAAAVAAAQPQDDTTGVVGEGDTRSGAAPLLAEQSRCRGFEAQYDDLATAAPKAMDRRYGSTLQWLETMRRRPRPGS